MITKFYSSIQNGNQIDCKNPKHYEQQEIYLLRDNFLSEYRTALEKAKVRANLGIADKYTLQWGNISGDVEEQRDIVEYINKYVDALLEFYYPGEDKFADINDVRTAIKYCLDYILRFEGEGEQINKISGDLIFILNKLYGVNTIEEIDQSEGGIINTIIEELETLKEYVSQNDLDKETVFGAIDKINTDISTLQDTLDRINELIKISTKEGNALVMITGETGFVEVPDLDEEGNPKLDDEGNPIMTTQEVSLDGLYVRDLSGDIKTVDDKIIALAERVTKNESDISDLNGKIDGINTEISGVKTDLKDNYVSKKDLGEDFDFVHEDTLYTELNKYIQKGTVADVTGITSSTGDKIVLDKPLQYPSGTPADDRRYVQSKSDLLQIKPEDAWPGMEVVVVADSAMYILKDTNNLTQEFISNQENWKTADGLIIVEITLEEYMLRKNNTNTDGTSKGRLYPKGHPSQYQPIPVLDSGIYYYITEDEIGPQTEPSILNFTDPVTGEVDNDAYNEAMRNYINRTYVLLHQYMSAKWGLELEEKIKSKASINSVNALKQEVDTINEFFNNSGSGVTLKQILESIKVIYQPANGNVPASGLLVTAQTDIETLKNRVQELEDSNFVKWSEIGEGENVIVTKDSLDETLEGYVQKHTIAEIDGISTENDAIEINKPLKLTTPGPLDVRAQVATKPDLYNIDPATAYKGMYVIVVDDAVIYMLENVEEINDPNSWVPVGQAAIINLTLEEYTYRKNNTGPDGEDLGKVYPKGHINAGMKIPVLEENVYYFITEGELGRPTQPKRENFVDPITGEINEDAYLEAIEQYKKQNYVLLNQYVSAAWAIDIENKVSSKATTNELNNLKDRVDTIDQFFVGGEGSLTELKDSINIIYRPAYVDKGQEKPESGLLVVLTKRVDILEEKVKELEDSNFIKWSEIGEGNEIVTEEQLDSKLENYVEKDTIAPLKGITSTEDTIVIDKPLEITSDKPLDIRSQVVTIDDLYKIKADTAYEGMYVIVTSEAVIYMLSDKSNITSSKGWTPVGQATIIELSLEEYLYRQSNTSEDGLSLGRKYPNSHPKAGQPIPVLEPNVYYYITEGPLNKPTMPNQNDFIDPVTKQLNEEAYLQAIEDYKINNYVLLNQYVSAAWGIDMENKINSKANQAQVTGIDGRVEEIEKFFAGGGADSAAGSLKGIKDSIEVIYKPEYIDNNGNPNPESGLLVVLKQDLNAIDDRVTTLENTDFVKWSEIGGDNKIVTQDQLDETLTDYVEKKTIADIKGIESDENTISVNKPIETTGAFPLDVRNHVQTYDDLLKTNPNTAYEGMYVLVLAESIIYALKDISKINKPEGWSAIGSAKIEFLEIDEYNYRKNNTSPTGESLHKVYPKSHPDVSKRGQEIPVLREDIYYFIHDEDVNYDFPEPDPDVYKTESGEFDSEQYQAAVYAWRRGQYILLQQYMSAAWGKDIENRMTTFAKNLDLTNTKSDVAANKSSIENLENAVRILESYFDAEGSNNTSVLKDNILALRNAIDYIYKADADPEPTGILVTFQKKIETDLYGDDENKPKFVTWEALGSESDSLDGEETLFVKTSKYKEDRAADAQEFTTNSLKLSNETVTAEGNDLKINDLPLALKDELIKKKEFNSYTEYLQFKESSEFVDGDWEDWYFIIKEFDSLEPKREDYSSDSEWLQEVENFKKNTLMDIYYAENKFQPKGNYLNTGSFASAWSGYYESTANGIEYKPLSQILLDLKNSITDLYADNDTKYLFVDDFKEVYDIVDEDNQLRKLSEIISEVETTINQNTQEFASQEIANQISNKVETSTLEEIFEGYYSEESGYSKVSEILNNYALQSSIDDLTTKYNNVITSLGGKADASGFVENDTFNAKVEELETADTTNFNTLDNKIDTEIETLGKHVDDFHSNMLEINYSDLVDLTNEGNLIPGTWYRIIDYVTTSVQDNTRVCPDYHYFDVLVLALSNSKLSEYAKATHSERDSETKYFENCNLSSWELKYRLANDDTNFQWVDTENGTGVIYEMKDEFNNICCYDFKNIQFERFEITNASSSATVNRLSGKYYSPISEFLSNYVTNNPFYGSLNGTNTQTYRSKWFYTFNFSDAVELDTTVYNANYGLDKCKDNNLGSVTYMDQIINQTFPGNKNKLMCNNVFIGNNFYSNIVTNSGFTFNTILTNAQFNTFNFGTSFNIFGNNLRNNIFGNVFQYNVIGNNFMYNTFGNYCNKNVFGDFCQYNTFTEYDSRIEFADNCAYNSIGKGCEYCYLSSNSNGNIFQGNNYNVRVNFGYFEHNTFILGVSSADLINAATTEAKKIQNINFKLLTVRTETEVDFTQNYFRKTGTSTKVPIPFNSASYIEFGETSNQRLVAYVDSDLRYESDEIVQNIKSNADNIAANLASIEAIQKDVTAIKTKNTKQDTDITTLQDQVANIIAALKTINIDID